MKQNQSQSFFGLPTILADAAVFLEFPGKTELGHPMLGIGVATVMLTAVFEMDITALALLSLTIRERQRGCFAAKEPLTFKTSRGFTSIESIFDLHRMIGIRSASNLQSRLLIPFFSKK